MSVLKTAWIWIQQHHQSVCSFSVYQEITHFVLCLVLSQQHSESLSMFLLQTSASCSRRLMKVVRLNNSSKFPNRKLPHNNLLLLKISITAAPPVEFSRIFSEFLHCQNQNSCMKRSLFSLLVPPIFIPPSPLFILVHLSFDHPSSFCHNTHFTDFLLLLVRHAHNEGQWWMMGVICRHGSTDKTAKRGRENNIQRPNLHNSRIHLTEGQCRWWLNTCPHITGTSHLGMAPAANAVHTPACLPCCQSFPQATKTQGKSSPDTEPDKSRRQTTNWSDTWLLPLSTLSVHLSSQ